LKPRIARRIIASLVICIAISICACSSKEKKFDQHVERATEFKQKGQLKEALLELRSALQLDPKSADVNFRIGEILATDNHPADAAFFYRETTRLDPTRSDAALAEAKLILFDDTARAEELIQKVLDREPGNAVAYIRRSELGLARGKSADALQAALTATELAPNDGMTHMQLGIVRLAQLRELSIKGEEVTDSHYQDAEKALKRAAELFPHGVVARIELGRLYSVWKDHNEQAMAAYRDAIAVADTSEQRGKAAGAATSFAKVTKNDEFERYALQTLVESVPANLTAWDQLAASEERREKGAGDSVYKRLIAVRADDIQAHLQYARFLFSNDRQEDAFQILEAQSKSGGNAPIALEEIVSLRLRNSEIEPARAGLDRLTKEFPAHPRTELAKGRVAMAENRFDEAGDALRRYVGLEETMEGQRLLALAELRRNNLPAATAAIDRAIQLAGSQEPDLLRLKASIHAGAGDYTLVMQTLNRLAREAGDLRPPEKLLYARALYSTGRRPAAKAILEEQLAGESPPVNVMIEFAQREGPREPDRAREYLNRVLTAQPNHAGALRLLAQIDIEAGNSHEALARIDKAAESGPLTPPLILLRAQILASDKDWTRAEEEARRAFAASPSLPGALELLANIYVAQNRLDEAIASFQEAEKVGALPISGQQLLARLHNAAGHRAEAKALYEKVLASRSDLPGAKNDLAWILAEEGVDLERALALAQEAQQAEPESAEIADTLGFVYLKKGLSDPALQQFKYAVELAGRAANDVQVERPEYHYHLGLALKSLGRNDEATVALERALQLDAKFGNADDARRELEAAKASAASGPG
jgi:tetratricopeptide (TPR) repeat protein